MCLCAHTASTGVLLYAHLLGPALDMEAWGLIARVLGERAASNRQPWRSGCGIVHRLVLRGQGAGAGRHLPFGRRAAGGRGGVGGHHRTDRGTASTPSTPESSGPCRPTRSAGRRPGGPVPQGGPGAGVPLLGVLKVGTSAGLNCAVDRFLTTRPGAPPGGRPARRSACAPTTPTGRCPRRRHPGRRPGGMRRRCRDPPPRTAGLTLLSYVWPEPGHPIRPGAGGAGRRRRPAAGTRTGRRPRTGQRPAVPPRPRGRHGALPLDRDAVPRGRAACHLQSAQVHAPGPRGDDVPLAWLRLEPGGPRPRSASRCGPEERSILARSGFHGRTSGGSPRIRGLHNDIS